MVCPVDKKRYFFVLLIFLCEFILPCISMSAYEGGYVLESEKHIPENQKWQFVVRWENDFFGGSDNGYTNGVYFGVARRGKGFLFPVVESLGFDRDHYAVGCDFLQLIFTPSDTRSHYPDINDRPYAGIMLFGLGIHGEKNNSYHGIKLAFGVVGPSALAKEAQREAHRYFKSYLPEGWHYQLRDEPIVNLIYEFRKKIHLGGLKDSWRTEVLPVSGLWLGNAWIQGQFGGIFRIGYNFLDDFGLTSIRGFGQLSPPRFDDKVPLNLNWGFSINLSVAGNLVVRDITLDGNTFKSSRSVDKKFFVPMGSIGLTINSGCLLFSFNYIFMGKEYNRQQNSTKIGSISFIYFF